MIFSPTGIFQKGEYYYIFNAHYMLVYKEKKIEEEWN